VFVHIMGACAPVGPDYQTPAIDVPDRFIDADATSAGEVAAQQWWLGLNDTMLNDLVARGMGQNLDIRTATERINEASAGLRATGPAAQVSGSGSASTIDSNSGTTNSGTVAASYALDIFGGARRDQEEAQAALDGVIYDVGTARLAFLALIVGNYIDARYYQEALSLTRNRIEARRQTVALTREQLELGLISELDFANAEALLNEAMAEIPPLETGFYTAVFGIATLLDEPAAPITDAMESGAPQPRPSNDVATGIPADILRNRPDVISAERTLAADTAAVGGATADLYPSLDLDGTITAADASSWSFGPTLSLPIFNQTALRASRDQQVSLAQQSELAWRRAVRDAIEDVQVAQSTYSRLQREVTARRAAAASYQKVLDLSLSTYQAGAISLLDLLEAERSNAAAQLALAGSMQSLSNAWVNLQVSTGRGWQITPTP
jgi:multidrug efflux system outer membrane protein